MADNPLADPENWEDADARRAQRALDAHPDDPRAEALRAKIKTYVTKKFGPGPLKPVTDEPPNGAPLDPVPAAVPPEAKPPAPAPQPGMSREPDAWDSFVAAAPMSKTKSAIVGERNPFDLGDEATGLGAMIASKVNGETPRTIARGIDAPLDDRSEYRVAQQNQLDLQKRAQHDNPWSYSLGKSGMETAALAPAMFANPLLGLAGLSAAGASAAVTLAESVGGAGLTSMGAGGLESAGASESQDPSDVVDDTANGMLVAGATGGALPLVARGLGQVGKVVVAGADYARGMAAGGRALPKGADVAAYGRQVNELGLPGILPRSVHGYEGAAGDVASETGGQLGTMRARSSDLNVGANKDEAISALEKTRDHYLSLDTDTGATQARVIDREISRLQARPGDQEAGTQVSVSRLANRANTLRGRTEGGFKSGSITPPSQTARAEAKREAASVYSKLEDSAMKDSALADDAMAHRALKDRFGAAADVRDAAMVRAHATRGPHIATDVGAGILGEHFGGPVDAIKAAAAAELASRYGADVGAKLGYAAGNPLLALGKTSETSMAFAPIGQEAAQAAPLLNIGRGANRGLPRPAPSQPAPSLPQDSMPEPQPAPAQSQQPQDDTKGHEQIGRIKQRLQAAPATFGKYATELTQALGSENPDDELATVVHRLAATDPQFRMHYMRGAQ